MYTNKKIDAPLQTATIIHMMRCINYLKIICDCNLEQRTKFETAIKET